MLFIQVPGFMFRYLDFFSAKRLIEVMSGYILHIKFCSLGDSAPAPFMYECSVTFESARASLVLSREQLRLGSGPTAADEKFVTMDEVNLDVSQGEALAIVSESGCGKTTLARMLLRLIELDSGEILPAESQ
jgi:ABC-type multidrug transport system fused ATPase/permease subunit